MKVALLSSRFYPETYEADICINATKKHHRLPLENDLQKYFYWFYYSSIEVSLLKIALGVPKDSMMTARYEIANVKK